MWYVYDRFNENEELMPLMIQEEGKEEEEEVFVESPEQLWDLIKRIDKKSKKRCDVFNLGTGKGVTVLEAIKAFEKVSGQKLNYVLGNRRPGDVVSIYANNQYAKDTLGWKIQYTLEDMMATAWRWEQKIKTDAKFYQNKSTGLN